MVEYHSVISPFINIMAARVSVMAKSTTPNAAKKRIRLVHSTAPV